MKDDPSKSAEPATMGFALTTKPNFISALAICAILLILLECFLLSSGCLGINTDDAKRTALDVISPVVVIKGSTQYEKQFPANVTVSPTVIPVAVVTTATPIPTPEIKAHYVEPFSNGERWKGQWFKSVTMRKTNPLSNVSPMKQLEFGILIYDHKYLNSYTWWSDVNGQYYKEIPTPGYKFLFVWVHEEVFKDPKTNIPLMPGFDPSAFIVQYKQNLYYNDTLYNPVNRILEFDTKGDYYQASRTSAFGYTRKYLGRITNAGGWFAEKNLDLYTGRGNSWDGYLIYQVPVSANDSDTILVGNFGSYGNAYWRFDIYV